MDDLVVETDLEITFERSKKQSDLTVLSEDQGQALMKDAV